ncbi:MAG TPA: DNA translocase FtsK [Solirubrobacteraceae bacterium]|nr:DNA translocase FtsK [Solirubrobacteraceae bacterium]
MPLHLPELDQRQRDVIGLGLIAAGIFMGFVLWGSKGQPNPGGRVGHGLAVALGWAAGKARGLAPVALVGAGGALLLRAVWPSLRPLRAGAVCLFASITLALAAGTLGVSSGVGASSRGTSWTSAFLQAHGGVAGEALYQAAHRLVQSVGVNILVVFLFLAGITLLSGASLASAIRATGSGVADTTRMLRLRVAAGEHRRRGSAGESMSPPEPAPEELIIRATHVEAPPLDGALADGREPWESDHLDADRAPETERDAGEPFVGDLVEEARAGEEQLDDGDGQEDEPSGVARVEPADGNLAGGAGPDQLTPQGRLRGAITDDPDFVWELPRAERLLVRSTADQTRPDTAGQGRTAASLVEALGHFGVQAKVIGTVAGPHITRYELRLAPGTKVAKVAQLKDDLAYALAATDVRILAPIPGKQAVGVEVPNAHRRIVKLGDVFQHPPKDWSPLTVWLGKDVAGKAIGADLAKMPHLLVAGTTGAGKSGAINAMLSSVLLRATPHDVRLVLVDPKQVELNHYESIPHLLTPVITSPRMAANALQNLVREMEQRYGIMSLARTRSLIELNKARARRGEAPLPYILCVIDELADLMMVAPADVEDSIIRLAQKARAVGIHLVLATQSPRVDVITGMIKANVPSRIAFAVSSQTDSRVILDQNGAESLLGQGDMLFSPVGTSQLQRIQGAYIDEAQIAKLTDLWRRQGEPELREELLEEVEPVEPEAGTDELDPDEDPMLRDAITLVAEMQTASTSMLQRRLRLGYTRAGRVIDMLERRGVISGYEGSKPRQVLISEADLPRILAGLESSPTQPVTAEAIPES